MTDLDPGAAGCAAHPDAPAVAVCRRCGGYMCEVCNGRSLEGVCPSCRARTGKAAFPLRRDAWSLVALLEIAWRAFTGDGIRIAFGFVVLGCVHLAISCIPSLLPALPARRPLVVVAVLLAWIVLDMVIVMGLGLGLMDMTFDALEGRPVHLGTLFWHLGKTGKLLPLLLVILGATVLPVVAFQQLTFLAIFLGRHLGTHARLALVGLAVGGLVALAGSVWLMIAVGFAQLELALDDGVGTVEALRRSFVLVRGKRWAIVGVGLVAGLVGLTGLLVCGVGLVASVPFAYLVMSGLFLALRNGAGLPAPVRRGRRARAEGGA